MSGYVRNAYVNDTDPEVINTADSERNHGVTRRVKPLLHRPGTYLPSAPTVLSLTQWTA